jgi:hypothetical protein
MLQLALYFTVMIERDLLWLAGLLEGEGCFGMRTDRPNQPYITIQMADEDIITRVAILWGMSYCANPPRQVGWKMCYRTVIRGRKAAILMRELRPLMGHRRQGQIDQALARYNPNSRWKLSQAQADDIRSRLSAGVKATILATEYGVGRATVYTCGRGEYVVPLR